MVFGTVLEGMKFVRQIEAQNGTPPKEDRWKPMDRSAMVLTVPRSWHLAVGGQECKIEDSGEIPLEKPYKDGWCSASRVAMCCHARTQHIGGSWMRSFRHL